MSTDTESAGPEQSPAHGPDLRIVSRGADEPDVAAVTAVLRHALDELAAGMETTNPPISAWQRSQRPLRSAITRGAGAWRAF